MTKRFNHPLTQGFHSSSTVQLKDAIAKPCDEGELLIAEKLALRKTLQ
jgi:hypothetical protein